MLKGPRPDGLGKLSAEFESGKRGTSAVGWDEGGGSSYGKYQLAFKVGTLKRFVEWCEVPFKSLHDALMPLFGSAGQVPNRKSPGQFMAKWLELANGPDLPKAEHEFIAVSHYDPAYSGMAEGPRTMVDKYRAVQDVLWSTAVQHGPGAPGGSKGAIGVFNYAFKEGIGVEQFIDAIYNRRGNFLGKLKQSTRAAVLNRYATERKKAKAILTSATSTPATTPPVTSDTSNQLRDDFQNGGDKK